MSFLLKKILEKKKIIAKARRKMTASISGVLSVCLMIYPLFIFKNPDYLALATLESAIFSGCFLGYILVNLIFFAKENFIIKRLLNKNNLNDELRENGIHYFSNLFSDSLFFLKRMKVDDIYLRDLENIISETRLERSDIQYIKDGFFPHGINNQADYISFLFILFEEEKLKIKNESYNEKLGEIIKKIDQNKEKYKKEESEILNY